MRPTSPSTSRSRPATSVSDALATRRSVRAFLDRPVDAKLIRDIVQKAARAPSGGNLQPWRIWIVAGEPLERLRRLMDEKLASSPRGEGSEYHVYPPDLASPYADRRFAVGEALYRSLGIPREDRDARRRWFARNWRFFDAPVGLFCFVDRSMGPPQWADLGMYLQSVMLLLREAGLDSCPQEAWALFPRTIADFLSAPDGLMLFCGMAIGEADPEAPVNSFPTARAPLEEFATFIGLEQAETTIPFGGKL
ncbi:nitroreductase family protein [Sphingosinicella terrae]|uniref:nitroreductase family protein n=1 Tax=Sphingosinicella terrae TaxID=2172047 RepID=UPI002546D548|nr:nitroreductase family protein [Sphingosinicella terrae]